MTVFTPDDLLVKGGPQGRRAYLDDLLVALHPRHEATISEMERVLKQRNALLKSAGPAAGSGRPLAADVTSTLDVWDTKLCEAGEALVAAREGLAAALEPVVAEAYGQVGRGAHRGRLLPGSGVSAELAGSAGRGLGPGSPRGPAPRGDDGRTPPRRVALHVGGLAGRTHASQGEQRSLALALRLAGHRLVTERVGTTPILLLDDVFSELDRFRSEALLACLPEGQALVTRPVISRRGRTSSAVCQARGRKVADVTTWRGVAAGAVRA